MIDSIASTFSEVLWQIRFLSLRTCCR